MSEEWNIGVYSEFVKSEHNLRDDLHHGLTDLCSHAGSPARRRLVLV